jgi:hypothetical protein
MTDKRTSQLEIAETVDRIAETIGLEIAPAHHPGVVVNFERITTLAALVMAFPLPDDIEIDQIFIP